MSSLLDIRNCDCMDLMRGFPDKHFDLAIVDPQTGQGEGKKHVTRPSFVKQKNGSKLPHNSSYLTKDWDSKPPEQLYYDELFRVSKHQIIMCENYLHFDQKKTSAGRIVWNLLRDNDFSACQIMWTSLTNKIEYFEYLWNGMIQGDAINSRTQLGDKSKNQKRIHPTEKPIKVYGYLLLTYAKAGWKILDTHGGSLSIAIACDNFNYQLTASEIDRDYYLEGISRLKQHQAQTVLFK